MLHKRLLGFSVAAFALMSVAAIPDQAHDRSADSSSSTMMSQRTGEDPSVLPVLIINLLDATPSEQRKSLGSIKVIEEHDGTHADLERAPVALQSRISFEIRGATSVVLPKKSYDLELVNERGGDRDLPLLGLPSDSDWALHGCGRDKTCLRNALAYQLARSLGRYAPRTQFVELVLNGQYHGLYVLTERIRRGPHRVDLPKPAANAVEGDLSGGYIFKQELGEGTEDDRVLRDWVSSVGPMVYSYHYPRFDEITDPQKHYLRNHMAAFETMMAGDGWNHPQDGYRAWIDVPSWVDFALLQELANNVDAYQKSVYFQKWPLTRGNKLALGPVWDFDNAFGVADFRDGRRTDTWAHRMNRFGTEPVRYSPPERVPHVPAYWERLWSDPTFLRDVNCRWRALRQGPLLADRLTASLDSLVAQFSVAQFRDGVRWRNPEAERYPAEVSALREWLARRIEWMDGNLPGSCSQP